MRHISTSSAGVQFPNKMQCRIFGLVLLQVDIKNPMIQIFSKWPEIADCRLCTASVSSFTYRRSFGSAANPDELFLSCHLFMLSFLSFVLHL